MEMLNFAPNANQHRMKNTRERLAAQFRHLAEITEAAPMGLSDEDLEAILGCLKVLVGRTFHTDMSLAEVSRYFGVTSRTIQRWQNEHNFPEGKRIGYHELAFHIDDVIAWKDAHSNLIKIKKHPK